MIQCPQEFAGFPGGCRGTCILGAPLSAACGIGPAAADGTSFAPCYLYPTQSTTVSLLLPRKGLMEEME